MNRPQVRQVQAQQIESEREVTGSEAEAILRKHGHTQEFSTRKENVPDSNPKTFEEMVLDQERKRKEEESIRRQKINSPKPITFDGRNGYDSRITYGSDDDSGLSFKIEISTDMKIPKY